MRRLLFAWLAAGCALAALATTAHVAADQSSSGSPVLDRFLAIDQSAPQQVVAVRRLEARNDKFDAAAWMEIRTRADGSGFRYDVLGEGGSGYIRSKVFRSALEAEQKMWRNGEPDRAAFTLANYRFEDRGAEPGGLAWLAVTPRRKDLLLVNGSIFLRPEDAELVRIEGTLAKSPSFWTRRVDIVRRYERIAGVRLPVWMESTVAVRIAGLSKYTTSYRYEAVNGTSVP